MGKTKTSDRRLQDLKARLRGLSLKEMPRYRRAMLPAELFSIMEELKIPPTMRIVMVFIYWSVSGVWAEYRTEEIGLPEPRATLHTSQIGKNTGCSVSTVRRAVKLLEELELVRCEPLKKMRGSDFTLGPRCPPPGEVDSSWPANRTHFVEYDTL